MRIIAIDNSIEVSDDVWIQSLSVICRDMYLTVLSSAQSQELPEKNILEGFVVEEGKRRRLLKTCGSNQFLKSHW